MLSILWYISVPSVCPPWRSVCSRPLPIFYWVIHLSAVESYKFFIYFVDQTLVWGIICKYIFPYSCFPFYFADVFFSHAEAFDFDEAQFIYSFLYAPCSTGHYHWKYGCIEYLRFSCLCSPLGLLWCCNLNYLSLLSILSLFLYLA